MSRTSLRKKRPHPGDPLERPSVSQVYYPDDVQHLIRRIEETPANMQGVPPAQKLQILRRNELAAGSDEVFADPVQSLVEPSMEQVQQNIPDAQILQNQLQNETQEQLLQDEPVHNFPVVNNSRPDRPEVIDLEKLPVAMLHNPSVVVDLTVDRPNDVSVVDLTVDTPRSLVEASPVIVHVNREPQERPSCRFATQLPRQQLPRQPRLYDDDIQELPHVQNPGGESSKTEEEVNPYSKKSITCPVCLDDYEMLKRRKRPLMSTTCGHIFCDKCIKDAVRLQNKCPTCRKKLSQRQLHPIYI